MKADAEKETLGFSLVEVVLALGVVTFAIVAILGMVPTGLSTSHGAQDETRAAQIAQAVLSSIASQAQTQFANIQLPLDGAATSTLDLTTTATKTIYADNNAKLVAAPTGAAYAVNIMMNAAPVGFDTGYANEVTVSVAWPAAAIGANQTKRNFVRIVSKY